MTIKHHRTSDSEDPLPLSPMNYHHQISSRHMNALQNTLVTAGHDHK